jgi:hypothetical protein
VRGGHQDYEAISAIRKYLKAGTRHDASENTDIRSVLGHRVDGLLAGSLHQFDADGGVALEKVTQIGGEMLDDRRNAAEDPNLATQTFGMVDKAQFHLSNIPEEQTRVVEKCMTGRREFQALCGAVEKRRFQSRFEIGNALADGRGSNSFAVGGLGDTGFFARGDEKFDGQQIEAHLLASNYRELNGTDRPKTALPGCMMIFCAWRIDGLYGNNPVRPIPDWSAERHSGQRPLIYRPGPLSCSFVMLHDASC